MKSLFIIVHSRGNSLFQPLARDIALDYIRREIGDNCRCIHPQRHLSMQNPFISSGHYHTLGWSPLWLLSIYSMRYEIVIPTRDYERYRLTKGHQHFGNPFIQQGYSIGENILEMKAEWDKFAT